MKFCLTSIGSRGVQIKAPVREFYTSAEMAKIKKTTIPHRSSMTIYILLLGI